MSKPSKDDRTPAEKVGATARIVGCLKHEGYVPNAEDEANRTVEFSKGSSAFAPLKTPAHTLESWGEKILGDLATENHLKGLKKAAFVERR